MTKLKIEAMLAAVLMTAVDCLAQDAASMARLRGAIVRVDGKTVGSGVVIAVDPGLVRIVTARHVVEGPGPRRDPIARAQRDCTLDQPDSRAQVTFQFFESQKYSATRCIATDLHDLALLEVPVQVPSNSIPPFKQPRQELEVPGTLVYYLGHTVGLGGGTIQRNEGTLSAEGAQFMTDGQTQGGFSGGPVIDVSGGLLGIVLSTSLTSTTSLRWTVIRTILSEWGVVPTNLEAMKTGDLNPDFEDKKVQNALNEGARTAIRQYVAALETGNRIALQTVYQSVNRADMQSLFGDARDIDLTLQRCTDRDTDTDPKWLNTIRCDYQLTIVRRTGPSHTSRSRSFAPAKSGPVVEASETGRMVFFLEDRRTHWIVTKVIEEKQ